MLSRNLRTISFLSCLIFLMIIGWERFIHPGLWAEDGKIFFADALMKGWPVIFQAYEGYFHLYNRICIQIFSHFPVFYVPSLITGTCFILYAWMVSSFAKKEFRYLVESDLTRILITLGFCFIPGTQEIIGNLCNTHRVLTLYLLFLALRPFTEKFTKLNYFFSFIVAGSAGEVLTLVPLFVYRMYQKKKQQLAIKDETIVLSIIGFWTIANILVRNSNTAPIHPDFFQIARASLAALIFNFTIQPTVGWRLGGNLFNHATIAFGFVSTTFFLVLMRDMIRSIRTGFASLYLAVLGMIGIQLLAWIVRPTDLFVYHDFYPGMWFSSYRYVYTLLFSGFFLWAVIFSKRWKYVGSAYVLLYFILANPIKLAAVGDTSNWKADAERLERSISSGCPQKVQIELNPKGWGSLNYESSKTPEQPCVE